MPPSPPLASRIPALLVRVRFAVTALVCTALAAFDWVGAPLPTSVWLLPPLLLAGNLLLGWRLHKRPVIGSLELMGHLLFDSLMLTLLLAITGGARNPFVSFFLVPVALGAVMLERRHAWLLTGLCLGAYTGLLLRYLDLAIFADMSHLFERHLVGMWLNFVLAALLLTLLLTLLMQRLRQHEQQLMQQREQLLRDDAVMAMASLAAGTAHALNTPLGIITLTAESLAAEETLSEQGRADLAQIATQADFCGRQLQRLAATAHPRQAENTTINRYAATLMQRWHARHATDTHIDGLETLPTLAMRDDPALGQALMNLFDNALDASRAAGSEQLAIGWQVANHKLRLTIDDQGAGTDHKRLNQSPATSSKPRGLGIGLILARACIFRLGGQLHFSAAPSGGTRCRVCLPLAALVIASDQEVH